jgi:hypothetical protein
VSTTEEIARDPVPGTAPSPGPRAGWHPVQWLNLNTWVGDVPRIPLHGTVCQ